MGTEQILVGGGTVGLIAFLFWVVRELWTDHKRRDVMIEEEREEALELVKAVAEPVAKLVEGQAAQTRVIEKLSTRRRAYDGRGDKPSSDRR